MYKLDENSDDHMITERFQLHHHMKDEEKLKEKVKEKDKVKVKEKVKKIVKEKDKKV